jgi:hypothetical protein
LADKGGSRPNKSRRNVTAEIHVIEQTNKQKKKFFFFVTKGEKHLNVAYLKKMSNTLKEMKSLEIFSIMEFKKRVNLLRF